MMTRRKFLGLATLALPAAAGADARWIEPTALRVTTLNRGHTHRFVHFTDFHHKGDTRYAAEVVRTINEQAPEFVCFTGDLVEDRAFATEALGFIQQIKAPVYGSPGNHDYRCGASFADYEHAFAATGGAWLVDRSILLHNGLELVGLGAAACLGTPPPRARQRIALMHYPLQAQQFKGESFQLMLAGHSHGGQVRLPFYGAPIVPWGVGPYQLGYYETLAGPLYVGAGIGTYRLPIRINCRPEITVVTI
ncbi:MAG: metallophosphoesterase [Chthoniobacterales bacterium]